MLDDDIRTRIRLLFYGEHWRIGTIAEQLGLHPDTVRGVVDTDSFVRDESARPSALDPYVDFIRQTLAQYPTLTGTRIHEMVAARGYTGSAIQVRRRIRRDGLRPKPAAEAFFELDTMPGEQGQVDWVHLGTLEVAGGTRPLYGLVVVLSWSRAFDVHFAHDMKVESVMRGHVQAFDFFGGVPRNILYDNMKTVVLERRGDAVRFHPRFNELSAHYLFSAVPCAPRRANEKGRVERRIRHLRESFLRGRIFISLDDIRAQFVAWRDEVAFARPCPEDESLTVAEALEQERPSLIQLPDRAPYTDERRDVVPKKTPYVRYDTNRYSVPHDRVGRILTLSASADRVRIYDGEQTVAEHERSWGRKQRVEDPAHLAGLGDLKKKARLSRGRDAVIRALPVAAPLYKLLAERNIPLGPETVKLQKLIATYDYEELDQALEHAIERGTPRAVDVEQILLRARDRDGRRSTRPLVLPERHDIQQTSIRNHDLGDYDDLS